MKGLFSLHLIDERLRKTALLNILSTSPCTEFFLSTLHKDQGYISLTTRTVTMPPQPSHPSMQRGMNQR